MDQPGRSCPLHYRYRPDVFAAAAPMLRAETLYVIGGLYGNVESLSRILAMKDEEEQATGAPVQLLFNGDFNWFDCDAASFRQINEAVLDHAALTGNVEAELGSESDANGCGCGYPDYVEQAVVDRSNAIMQRLRQCAGEFPDLQRRLAALPMHCTVEVGARRIGIVHGDAESLAGWNFAYEAMPALPGEAHVAQTGYRAPVERIAGYFRQARVSAFASTHTCLPFVQDFEVDGERRLVINNGAAGMPNFTATSYGLLTRISARREVPAGSLYGTSLPSPRPSPRPSPANGRGSEVRFDALPIRLDQARWIERFSANWPAGSPGRVAYFKRITEGPDFEIQRAVRLQAQPGAS